jgi:hypothetical protein
VSRTPTTPAPDLTSGANDAVWADDADVRTAADWVEANQLAIIRSLDGLRARLERHAGRRNGDGAGGPGPGADARFALERLRRAFDLSPFERDVVLLCASVELDARFISLVAEAQGDPSMSAPTFGLALAALPDAHWSALSPDRPLRSWRLVTPGSGALTTSPLRIDERILHYLVGLEGVDERLRPLLGPVGSSLPSGATVRGVARDMAAILVRDDAPEVIQLTGREPEMRAAVVTMVGELFRAPVLRLRTADLPTSSAPAFEIAVLCAREWRLGSALILLDEVEDGDDGRIRSFADAVSAPLLVSVAEPIAALADRGPVLEVPPLPPPERAALWRAAIGPAAARLDGALDRSLGQFELGPAAIRAAAGHALLGSDGATVLTDSDRFWDACRAAARPRMGGLAQPVEAIAGWDDLVLPEFQRRILRVIAAHVRRRHLVYDEWGFARKSARGLGISALFVGESGTGKTMAAEVLARELRLDLYRIDLASVVSKYIGETEKNLRQLFDAAEGSGAILLFDEADALFGRRSEVRDSHDRYANVEVSYLLQRMEAYRGLAILTTNMRQALDPAFLRRIRFIVTFPHPDAAQRAAIWRGVFPERTPLDALDYPRLAQLNVAGGHIRNIAMAGAFLAAEAGNPVSMLHLAHAARDEYSKLERSLTDAESRGWA